MKIDEHPEWQWLKPHLRTFIKYGKNRKIEVRGLEKWDHIRAMAIRISCAACNGEIQPCKPRKLRQADQRIKYGGIFFSVTCGKEQNPGCSNGKKSTKEIDRLCEILNKKPPTIKATGNQLELSI